MITSWLAVWDVTSHAGLPDDPDLASAEGLRVKTVHSALDGNQDNPILQCYAMDGRMKEDLINFSAPKEMFRGRMRLRNR